MKKRILEFYLCACVVLGMEPRGILPPSYTPWPTILYFIWKQGLTKLLTVSLSSWGWLRTCSDPPVSASQCWDYKREPPHPAQAHFLIFYLKQGLTKLQRASLNTWGCPRTLILQSQPPKCWYYKLVPPGPAYSFILKRGLIKLQRASLSSKGWLQALILCAS